MTIILIMMWTNILIAIVLLLLSVKGVINPIYGFTAVACLMFAVGYLSIIIGVPPSDDPRPTTKDIVARYIDSARQDIRQADYFARNMRATTAMFYNDRANCTLHIADSMNVFLLHSDRAISWTIQSMQWNLNNKETQYNAGAVEEVSPPLVE